MSNAAVEMAKAVKSAIQSVPPPPGNGRPSTREIYAALTKGLRRVVAKEFGGPVYRRYSGCPEGPTNGYSTTPGKAFKVLEYLWDFSLSRHAIPQAIRDPHASAMAGGPFELLLVGESELGTQNEICRDLLKLLDARARVRCLVYRQPRRDWNRTMLESRILQVMRGHAHFLPNPGLWLFAGVSWTPGSLACTVRTLTKAADGLVEL